MAGSGGGKGTEDTLRIQHQWMADRLSLEFPDDTIDKKMMDLNGGRRHPEGQV
jgi:hypothetical protein